MFYARINPGEMLFEQDDVGSCFFILEKGSMQILVDGVVKKELKPLDGFGELALLYHHKRTSAVKADTGC